MISGIFGAEAAVLLLRNLIISSQGHVGKVAVFAKRTVRKIGANFGFIEA